MNKKFYIIFIFSLSFARWSIIEKIDRQDDLSGVYTSLFKGRSIAIDFIGEGNKFVVYVRQPGGSLPGQQNWLFSYKPQQYAYNNWQTPFTIYSLANQMAPPPHCKPSIFVDNQNRAHVAFSYIDVSAGNTGIVYYRQRDASGNWDALVSLSPVKDRPGNVAIATNSNGIRRIVAYTYASGGQWNLECAITTNDVSWSQEIPLVSNVDDAQISVAVDEAGYFYIIYSVGGIYYCVMLNNASPFSPLWAKNLNASYVSCVNDIIDGNVHFGIIRNDSLIYLYRVNGDIDSSSTHWYGTAVLLTPPSSRYVSISAYDSVIGILSGRSSAGVYIDTLYFKQVNYSGIWDTTSLPRIGAAVYCGRSVSIDMFGNTHIIGNSRYIAPDITATDSIFYFTDRLKPDIIIIPDTITFPDTGGITYPGVPITYQHKIITRNNFLDTVCLYIKSKKIDSVAALIWGGDTFPYPETLYIPDMGAFDTTIVHLLIIPSDTCRPCFLDTTIFVAYSKYQPTERDSAADTTHVKIDVVLRKEAITPPVTQLIYPLDTITYRIIFRDTWGVFIDSITIYDNISTTFDTAWFVFCTSTDYTFSYSAHTVTWTIRNKAKTDLTDTLGISCVVKEFDCGEPLPASISNSAYTPGKPCIDPASSNTVTHSMAPVSVGLTITKASIPASGDTLLPGDTITYYITTIDTSRFPVQNVIVVDLLDDDAITPPLYISSGGVYTPPNKVIWNIPCLLTQDTFRCTLKIGVGYEYKGDTIISRIDTVNNIGYVKWGSDSLFSNTITHFVRRKIHIIDYKTSSPATGSLVLPGDTIHYTLTFINNDSANSIMRNITLIDTVDRYGTIICNIINANPPYDSFTNGKLYWIIDSIGIRDTFIITYDAIICNTAPDGDSVVNFYRFIYPGVIDQFSNDTTIHYIRRPHIVITKNSSPPALDTVLPGDTVRYYLNCTNISPVTARNIIIDDSLDSDDFDTVIYISSGGNFISPRTVRWQKDSITPGASFLCTLAISVGYIYKGDTILSRIDTLNNFAVVTWSGVWGSASDTTDTITHFIGRKIHIIDYKYANPPTGSIVEPGDTINYTLRIINNDSANSIIRRIIIIDTVDRYGTIICNITNANPPYDSFTNGKLYWHKDSLRISDTFNITYSGIICNTAPDGDSVVNFYRFIYPGVIDQFSNDTTIHYIRRPIVTITKKASPHSLSAVTPGDTVWYYLNCKNISPVIARNIVVEDTLDEDDVYGIIYISPPGVQTSPITVRWSIDSILGNDSTICSLAIIVGYEYKGDTTISRIDTLYNFAWTIYQGVWGSDTSYTDTVIHYITRRINITNEKISNPPNRSVISPGDSILYKIIFKNSDINSNSIIRNIEIRDTIHQLIDTLKHFSPPPYDYNQSLRRIIWIIDSLAPGDSFFAKFYAYVSDTAHPRDSVLNWYKFNYPGVIEIGSQDTTVHYIGRVKKNSIPVSGTSVRLNQLIQYFILYVPGDTHTTIIDTVSNLVNVDTLSISDGGVWNALTRKITWELSTIPGRLDTVRFNVYVKDSPAIVGDTIFNHAKVIFPYDTFYTDTTLHLIVMPNVTFEKTSIPVSGSYVTSGDRIQYRLRCRNNGSDTAIGITIYDTLSQYFISPDTIVWNIGNLPPNTQRETLWIDTIKLTLPPTAWGDTVWNIPVLVAQDPDVATLRDTTIHILKNIAHEQIDCYKFALTLDNYILPEYSTLFVDSSFYYEIKVKNNSSIVARNIRIDDTVRSILKCAVVDSVIFGPDSCIWDTLIYPPNYIGWYVPEINPGDSVKARFRVHIKKNIQLKNVVTDTIDTLKNTFWLRGANIEIDSSNTYKLYVATKYGVEIIPDEIHKFIFFGETYTCTLKVKNAGVHKDSIKINKESKWQVQISDTLLPNVEPDSFRNLIVKIKAPDSVDYDTIRIIGTSAISIRQTKIVKDTAIIYCTAGERIPKIRVEPDTMAYVNKGENKNYNIWVINEGNDYDVIDIDIEKLIGNGWSYSLTPLLIDNDNDGKIDVGVVPPNDSVKFMLTVKAPQYIEYGKGIASAETIVVWGTSSWNTTIKDSAKIITKIKIEEISIGNYPNPFRSDKGTKFIVILPEDRTCDISVYTRKGELVKNVIKNVKLNEGRNEIIWNGENEEGDKVAPEVYIYIFKSGDKKIVKKLVVLPPKY